MIIYRTTGPWGAGKGSNLTAPEVDGNFHDLTQRIADVEDNPPTPISIADITMVGSQIFITLTNGEEFGPFNVPTATFIWRDEWTPSTVYAAFDVFKVTGVGQYLVINPHTSPTTFDPESADISLMFAIPDQAVVPVQPITAAGEYQVVLTDMGTLLRFTAATAVQVVMPDATEDSQFPVGSVISITKKTDADVEVQFVSPVIVNTPETYFLRTNGSTATLIKVATQQWDLTGDLELAE